MYSMYIKTGWVVMCSKTIKIFSLTVIFLAGCSGSGEGTGTNPGDPPTVASVGRSIFFDTNLSSGSNQSCADCHDPAAGFADPNSTALAPVSEGSVGGEFGNRNAPTAAYASFSPEFRLTTTPQTSDDGSKYEGGQFLDGRRSNLVEQAKDPFLNPVEMNNADATEVVNKVRNASYANDFLTVFGATALDDDVTAYNFIAQAIAAFEASPEVNQFSSKYDAHLLGQYTMTSSEANGLTVFTGTKAKCANCHVLTPPGQRDLFTNFKYFNVGTPVNEQNPAYIADNSFRDNGMGGRLDFAGTADETGEQGKFKVPTLRNVERTAPYMHNGFYTTLEEVVTHYDIVVANGFFTTEVEVGSNIATELDVGGTGLGLTVQETNDLVAFMKTLTDGYF